MSMATAPKIGGGITPTPPPRRLLTPANVVALYPILLLAISLVHAMKLRTMGLLALTQVFAPYLFLPLLLLLLLALRRRAIIPRVTLALGVTLFLIRFGPWLPPTVPTENPAATHLEVLNWNVHNGGDLGRIKPLLLEKKADIVALEEADNWWIDSDAEIAALYPYRVYVAARNSTPGIVALSKYRVLDWAALDNLSDDHAIWLRVALPDSRTLTTIAVHTTRPWYGSGWCPTLLLCYDPRLRDNELEQVEDFVDGLRAQGERVLLMGDLNLTDREPAYEGMASRLVDAQRATGSGLVHTWRPERFSNISLALLRIDLLFSSADLAPLRVAVDCSRGWSDHCVLQGRFEVR